MNESSPQEEITAIFAPLGGRVAVAARKVGRRAPRALHVAGSANEQNGDDVAVATSAPPLDVALNVDKVFPAASLAKLPIAIELMRRVDMGQFDLAEPLATGDFPRAGGAGVLDYLNPSTQLTLGDVCTLMLIVSDNTAANILLDLVGMGEVNETLNRLRLPNTRLARRFMDFEARAAHRDNLTTAAEMLSLLELIRGNALPGGRRIRQTLAAQQSFSELTEGWLPPTATLAHKDGTLEDVVHDAGILTGPSGAGVYSILTTEQVDIPATRAAIGRALRALWDSWRLG
jgi:beta-lactamase class A